MTKVASKVALIDGLRAFLYFKEGDVNAEYRAARHAAMQLVELHAGHPYVRMTYEEFHKHTAGHYHPQEPQQWPSPTRLKSVGRR